MGPLLGRPVGCGPSCVLTRVCVRAVCAPRVRVACRVCVCVCVSHVYVLRVSHTCACGISVCERHGRVAARPRMVATTTVPGPTQTAATIPIAFVPGAPTWLYLPLSAIWKWRNFFCKSLYLSQSMPGDHGAQRRLSPPILSAKRRLFVLAAAASAAGATENAAAVTTAQWPLRR